MRADLDAFAYADIRAATLYGDDVQLSHRLWRGGDRLGFRGSIMPGGRQLQIPIINPGRPTRMHPNYSAIATPHGESGPIENSDAWELSHETPNPP